MRAGATLPSVVRWEAWNEPNLQAHLKPQWKAVGTTKQVGRPFCFGKSWVPASPGIYRGILNAIYRGVHAAGKAAGLTETVAGGATAPYGRGPCAVVPGFAPLAFLRDLVEKPVSLDVWSHHPYRNSRQNAAPFRGDNIDVQGMPRLYAALTKAFHGRRVPVWVTEFGAQTKPPDTRQGVTLAAQARQLRQAVSTFQKSGRVKMLVWFLVRDEDIAGRAVRGRLPVRTRVLQRQAQAGVRRLPLTRRALGRAGDRSASRVPDSSRDARQLGGKSALSIPGSAVRHPDESPRNSEETRDVRYHRQARR